MNRSNPIHLPMLLAIVFIFIGVQTLVAVPSGLVGTIMKYSFWNRVMAGGAIALVVLGAGLIFLRLSAKIDWPWEKNGSCILWNRAYSAIIIGIVLRSLVIIVCSVEPKSDAKVFMSLGQMLAEDQPYYFAHRWAYWPVGYPLFLSILFRVFGESVTGIQIANLFMYVITCYGIHKLAWAVDRPKAGIMALWIFALWPDLVIQTAYPSKELLAIAAVIWIMALLLWPCTSRRAIIGLRIGAGLLLGLLILVQPSFLLSIPILAVASFAFRRRRYSEMLSDVLIVAAAAFMVVAPWTARNYRVLGAFVPVSTNSGEVLYRANNPLATGGYVKRGEVDLWNMPELEAHRQGIRLAKEWILANPGSFLKLTLQKQFMFLEDDSIGLYEVLRRGRGGAPISERAYYILKFFCAAYWYFLWTLFTAGLIFVLRRGRQDYLTPLFAALPFLYLYAIHSIFESGPRYHQPISAVLVLVMSAVILSAVKSIREDGTSIAESK